MKKILLMIFCAVISLGTFAQEVTLKGVVTSADDGQSLPGVTVVVKGTTNGTVTNIDGVYQLDVQADDVLQFSFVGMKTVELPVSGKTELNVVLESAAFDVDEVVVVGYGTQKKSLVTGAIAKVENDELTKTSDMRVSQALQGKTPGVVISSNSGQPGDGVSVSIRGIGTNGNSNPLYIVDGLPLSDAGIDFLNSNDVESVEVLKDAASCAIYGARGANGVIIITTKTGRKGESFKVSYDGYYGVQNPWKKNNVLNAQEYVTLTNEASLNGNGVLRFTPAEIAGFTADTDWQDEMFNYDAPKQNHSLSFTGGTEKIMYSSSLNYFSQEGIVGEDNSDFEKFSYRLNTVAEFGFLDLGSNINVARIVSRGISTNDHFGNGLNQALNMPPIVPVKNEDGSWATPEQFGIGLQEITNPVGLLDQLNSETKTSKFVGGLFADIDFAKISESLQGLSFKSSFNGEYALVDTRGYVPHYYLDAMHFTVDDEASRAMDVYSKWNFENVLTYDKTIDAHHFTVILGTTAYKDKYENLYGSKKNVIFDDLEHSYIDNATDPESMNVGGGYAEHTVSSLFGRINYDLKDRYLFSATLRRDGSSRFGSENKYGYFPSVSAGWVLSREGFMENSNWADMLKLRASWGQNGSESIGDFGYTSIIGNQNIYYYGDLKTQYNGTQPTKIANPSLRWETSEQTNIGVDFLTLQSSLQITLDYYVKSTIDWLLAAPVPMLVGNSAPTVNGGEVRNSGFEADISYKKQFNKLYMNVRLNGAYNTNEVIDIDNSEKRLQGGGGAFGQGDVVFMEVGTPMGYFKGLKTDGIFQTQEEIDNYVNASGEKLQPNARPGDIKFVDADGNGVISTEDDRVNLGSPHPDFTGGLNITLEYAGFDFNMFIYAAFGQEIYDATRRYDMNETNYRGDWLNRWTGPGTSNTYPRVTFVDENENMRTVSDFFVEDGDYTRFRNITLGYTLPKKATKYLKLDKMRFYISGENLLTYTDYKGFDPEIGGSVFDKGIDHGIYPQARTVLGGVNITF